MRPILVILLALVCSAATWRVQDWRYGAKEKEHVEQQLKQVQTNAAANIRRIDNVITAQNAAAARAVVLRRAADAARDELERVRGTSAASLTAARASHQACLDNAATLKAVFDSCTGRLAEVGRAADGHANDVQTLSEAWPKWP